jgi:hypothetical protein
LNVSVVRQSNLTMRSMCLLSLWLVACGGSYWVRQDEPPRDNGATFSESRQQIFDATLAALASMHKTVALVDRSRLTIETAPERDCDESICYERREVLSVGTIFNRANPLGRTRLVLAPRRLLRGVDVSEREIWSRALEQRRFDVLLRAVAHELKRR